MFGWINDCCESLVVTKFGLEKWHEVKSIAGCTVEDGGFIRHQYYTDESIVELVIAVSKVLGISVDAVLEAFGQYFMEFTRNAGYGNLLSCQGSNLKLWLSNLNALHDHLQDTLPRGRFPEFWCQENLDVKGSLLLHYYSERGALFVPFVVGLVKEVAHFHFRLLVSLERLQTQGDDDAEYTTWRIVTLDPEQMHKLTANVGWAPEYSDFEDTLRDADIKDAANAAGCPFHAMERKAKSQTISEKAAERFWSRATDKNNSNINADTSTTGDAKNGDYANDNGDELMPMLSERIEVQTVTQEGEEESSPHNFISNENMKEMCPFHMVVDAKFNILQAGNNLHRVLGMGFTHTLIGRSLQDLFEIKRPVLASWDWNVIDKFQEQTFYIRSKAHDLEKVHLKAHFMNLSLTPKHVFVAISPDAKNIRQLREMKLTMSDLPIYTFQREAIFLGEHMLSGIRSSHKLDKLSRKLAFEHNLSNTLLYSMLPQNVAQILRSGETFEPSHHENVTLFFSDVVGFTDMCSELPPWDIIDMLNRLYNVMDYLAAKFKLYKVETIGDAYMCCSGLPEPNKYHAEDVVNFALAVRECVSLVKSPLTNEPIRIRIGIHTGSCMSGVVGTLTPHYCLFGDMVNTTSRHESTGEPGKIHCSNVIFRQLSGFNENPGYYNFTARGLVDMKGKGKLFTYWLDSAAEMNPYAGPTALEKIVKEVQEMLKVKTWKKRKYFQKRASESTSADESIVESGHEQVYVENVHLLKTMSSSITNADKVMEDDLSMNIRRLSMLSSSPLATNESTDTTSDTDGAEDHGRLNSSYHHLHTHSRHNHDVHDCSMHNSSARHLKSHQESQNLMTLTSRQDRRKILPRVERRIKGDGKKASKNPMTLTSRQGHRKILPRVERRIKGDGKKKSKNPMTLTSRQDRRKILPRVERRIKGDEKKESKNPMTLTSRQDSRKLLPRVERRIKGDGKSRNQNDVFHRLWINSMNRAAGKGQKQIDSRRSIPIQKSGTETSKRQSAMNERKQMISKEPGTQGYVRKHKVGAIHLEKFEIDRGSRHRTAGKGQTKT